MEDCCTQPFESRLNPAANEEGQKCAQCQETAVRVEKLRKQGVQIEFGVDARYIDTKYPGKHFKHIHWNCPHDGKSYENRTLPKIIIAFFTSARHLQQDGDHIHITLALPPEKVHFYQGIIYGIAEAAGNAGYRLSKKRRFTQRFPNYQHTKTKNRSPALVVDAHAREFVFVKVSDATLEQAKKAVNETNEPIPYFNRNINLMGALIAGKLNNTAYKTLNINNDPVRAYTYECKTDEDSSDYSDNEKIPETKDNPPDTEKHPEAN